jgi:uncharacterized protein with NRDE domain
MGVTEAGFFVGVTNQRTLRAPDPTKRSRGDVVMAALGLGESASVTAMVTQLDGRDYNAFNLMWGDAAGLYVAYARDGERALRMEAVPPGVHVLPNDVLDSPDFFKVGRAKALLRDVAHDTPEGCLARLSDVLADRATVSLDSIARPPEGSALSPALLRELSALCVRTPSYGTRSSALIALVAGGVSAYRYADGPLETTPFVDVRPLFSAA